MLSGLINGAQGQAQSLVSSATGQAQSLVSSATGQAQSLVSSATAVLGLSTECVTIDPETSDGVFTEWGTQTLTANSMNDYMLGYVYVDGKNIPDKQTGNRSLARYASIGCLTLLGFLYYTYKRVST